MTPFGRCSSMFSSDDRSLEEYLRALWRLGCAHRAEDALPRRTFEDLLDEARRAAAPPFDQGWAVGYGDRERSGHARWERTILDQIVDLHEMAEVGNLANELRYFGIASPRGSDWYNFDPDLFLDCAACCRDIGEVVSWDDFATFLWFGQHYE
jgi:hypothetical protein